jgi:hypothetical protein
VAGRADFNLQIFTQRRTSHELVAAAAADFYLGVIWMSLGFHGFDPARGA